MPTPCQTPAARATHGPGLQGGWTCRREPRTRIGSLPPIAGLDAAGPAGRGLGAAGPAGRGLDAARPGRPRAGTCAAIAAIGIAAVTGCSAAKQPAASPAPTLGQLAGLFARGAGFGHVKPARIFNGGDPTGLVTHIVWGSWGGAQAVATGTSEYVGPGQTAATGTEERASIVAFNRGTCDGKLMYQAVEWYFPQHGQAFDPNRYENICSGAYVPAS